MRYRLPWRLLRVCGYPLLVALGSLLIVLATIDTAGRYPNAPQGPGLTLDEVYNVEQGVYLFDRLCTYRLAIVHPDSVKEVFNEEKGFNPDHPPLGRFLIGLSHYLTLRIAPPINADTPRQLSIASARTASALAFAAFVFLVGCTASGWYGQTAGFVTSLSLVLMPRLFGHAHLAALETFVGLTYTAAVLAVATTWKNDRHNRPRLLTAALTGVVFGLVLLTKIQAILLPIPVALWALFYWRRRAILPLAIWSCTGLLVFFIFWPWLWLDPIGHLREYLGRTTGRLEVYVWYFGRRLADHDVPWHYPAVLFLTTVPVGLHFLGAYGLSTQRGAVFKDRRIQLVLACLLFPLVLFSVPGIAVYDGARLFLVVFPLWAILIGYGGAQIVSRLRKRWSKPLTVAACAVFLGAQSYGLFVLCPCYLSYYNLLVGGLPGAQRLGLQTTYWRDSVTRNFLQEVAEQVPEGARVGLLPVLHPNEPQALFDESPILRARGIQLRMLKFDEDGFGKMKYVLLFQRQADLVELPEGFKEQIGQAKLLAEVRLQGVQLSALYELHPQTAR